MLARRRLSITLRQTAGKYSRRGRATTSTNTMATHPQREPSFGVPAAKASIAARHTRRPRRGQTLPTPPALFQPPLTHGITSIQSPPHSPPLILLLRLRWWWPFVWSVGRHLVLSRAPPSPRLLRDSAHSMREISACVLITLGVRFGRRHKIYPPTPVLAAPLAFHPSLHAMYSVCRLFGTSCRGRVILNQTMFKYV